MTNEEWGYKGMYNILITKKEKGTLVIKWREKKWYDANKFNCRSIFEPPFNKYNIKYCIE